MRSWRSGRTSTGSVYAETVASARMAYATFTRKWAPRCPGVLRSLHEGGEELLTFFAFPKAQWKTLRTTNVIEILGHIECLAWHPS
jgi:transposase-like protein